jgi:hypothetical protein
MQKLEADQSDDPDDLDASDVSKPELMSTTEFDQVISTIMRLRDALQDPDRLLEGREDEVKAHIRKLMEMAVIKRNYDLLSEYEDISPKDALSKAIESVDGEIAKLGPRVRGRSVRHKPKPGKKETKKQLQYEDTKTISEADDPLSRLQAAIEKEYEKSEEELGDFFGDDLEDEEPREIQLPEFNIYEITERSGPPSAVKSLYKLLDNHDVDLSQWPSYDPKTGSGWTEFSVLQHNKLADVIQEYDEQKKAAETPVSAPSEIERELSGRADPHDRGQKDTFDWLLDSEEALDNRIPRRQRRFLAIHAFMNTYDLWPDEIKEEYRAKLDSLGHTNALDLDDEYLASLYGRVKRSLHDDPKQPGSEKEFNILFWRGYQDVVWDPSPEMPVRLGDENAYYRRYKELFSPRLRKQLQLIAPSESIVADPEAFLHSPKKPKYVDRTIMEY